MRLTSAAQPRLVGVVSPLVLLAVLVQRAPAQDDVRPDAPYATIARQAAVQPAPLWKLPLGATRVDVMRPAGRGRILVGLRKDDAPLPNLEYLLVRLEDGAVLWRVKRDADGTSRPLFVLDDGIVVGNEGEQKYTLRVIESATGKERWSRSFKDEDVTAQPVSTADRLLVQRRRKDKVEIMALALSTGREAWHAEFAAAEGDTAPAPLAWMDGALLFYDGVARVALEDGAVVWSRPELTLGHGDPPPQREGGTVYVARGAQVAALDLATGASRWTYAADGYTAVTNMYPEGETLYLRGIANAGGRERLPGTGPFVLSALGKDDGEPRWHRRSVLPTVSNLVRVAARVFVATPERMLGFNAVTGEPVLDVVVAPGAHVYPVRLRASGDQVSFLGEYVVVTLEAATGAERTRVAVTPLSQKASLAGLDLMIPRLKEQIAVLSTGLREVGGGPGSAAWTLAEANRYQNLANQYRSSAVSRAGLGDDMGAELDNMRGRMNRGFAKQMATLAFFRSALEFIQQLQQARLRRQIAKVEGLLEHQFLFRDAILSGQVEAESEEYVARPTMVDVQGGRFACVTVLHLPTGRRRTALLSPNYDTHGLWTLYDAERGVLYHEGIGLDTAAYTWSAKHSTWPGGKVRTIETYLMATPVALP
jgi:outer membrane protein assembly factor BamB